MFASKWETRDFSLKSRYGQCKIDVQRIRKTIAHRIIIILSGIDYFEVWKRCNKCVAVFYVLHSFGSWLHGPRMKLTEHYFLLFFSTSFFGLVLKCFFFISFPSPSSSFPMDRYASSRFDVRKHFGFNLLLASVIERIAYVLRIGRVC